jgi:periplasmic divalent cation tolerance protein
MKLSLGYITAPTKAEAKEIAVSLVEEGLVACANIIPGVESYFLWESEMAKATEYVIILKTKAKNQDKIVRFVKELHSYDCPCVVFMPIEGGNEDFLNWVEGSC